MLSTSTDYAQGFARFGSKAYKLLSTYYLYTPGRKACEDLNSSMALPESDVEVMHMSTVYYGWVRVLAVDLEEEGTWRNPDTGELVEYLPWNTGAAPIATGQNCLIIYLRDNNWDDYYCNSYAQHVICEVPAP
ncbi:uncharacterized protein LOC121869394 isoform X1 [Homarus americanus]|nr:uncharacterized protein LOC121869394 isoform X1 [Homarus americanus]